MVQRTYNMNQAEYETFQKSATDLWNLMLSQGKNAINLREHPEAREMLVGKIEKHYTYGCNEVYVDCYDNGLTLVTYVPTVRELIFKNRQDAFNYAKGCKQYISHIGLGK